MRSQPGSQLNMNSFLPDSIGADAWLCSELSCFNSIAGASPELSSTENSTEMFYKMYYVDAVAWLCCLLWNHLNQSNSWGSRWLEQLQIKALRCFTRCIAALHSNQERHELSITRWQTATVKSRSSGGTICVGRAIVLIEQTKTSYSSDWCQHINGGVELSHQKINY